MDRNTRSELLRLRGTHHATGTTEVKADKTRGIRHMVEDTEAGQDTLGLDEETEDDYFVRLHDLLIATKNQRVTPNPNPATQPRSQAKGMQPMNDRTIHLFVKKCWWSLRRQTTGTVLFVPPTVAGTSTTPSTKWYRLGRVCTISDLMIYILLAHSQLPTTENIKEE